MPEYLTHLRECIGCLCNVNTTQTRQPRTGACAVCERPRPAHASPGLAGVCLAETETPEPGDFLLDETCIGNFGPFSYELRNWPTNRPIHGESLPQQTKLVPSLDHAETAQARSIEPTGHAMGKPSDAKSSTPTAQLLERASLC